MPIRRRGTGGPSAQAADPSGPESEEQKLNRVARVSKEESALAERIELDAIKHQASPSRTLEKTVAFVLVAGSCAALIGARNIDVANETGGYDPRWWPTIITVIVLLLSIMLAIVAFVRPPFERDNVDSISDGGWTRLGATAVVTLLFIYGWRLSGNFVVPCALFLGALIWSYGGKGWKAILVFPVVTTAMIYVLFHTILKVPL